MSDQNYLPYDELMADPDYQFEQLDFGTPGLTGPSFLDAPSPPQIAASNLSPAQLAVEELIARRRTSTAEAYQAWVSLSPEQRVRPTGKVIAGRAGKQKANKISEADVTAFVEVHGITDSPKTIYDKRSGLQVQWPEWHPENHAKSDKLPTQQLEAQAYINTGKTPHAVAYEAWVSLSPEQRVPPTCKVVAGHTGVHKQPDLGVLKAFMEAHGITDKPETISQGRNIAELRWPVWRPEKYVEPTTDLSGAQLAVRAILEKRSGVGAYPAWVSLPPEQRIKPNRRVIAEYARKKTKSITPTDIDEFVRAHGIGDAFRLEYDKYSHLKEVQWPEWRPANHTVPPSLSVEQFSAAAEVSSSGVSADPLPPSGVFPTVQDPQLVAGGAEAVTMGAVASSTPYTYGDALPGDMDFAHFSHDPSGSNVPNQAFDPAYAAYVAPDAYDYPGQGQQSSIMPTGETAYYSAPSGASNSDYSNVSHSNASVSSWAMPSGYGGYNYNAGASASSSSQNTSSIPPAVRGHNDSHSGPNKRGRRR